MLGKGVDKLPWARIPAHWDPVWFARMMREVWALADTRNAIAGDGVVITGTPDVPATISASPDVLNLLLQPYVTASASAFLPNERILTSSARISVTDGGAGGAITPDLVIGSIASLYLEQQGGWSVFGRSPNTTGYLQSIQATNDGEVLRVSGSYLGFGQVATAGIADAAVTYQKIQNVTATARFLGRITSGAGVVEELTGAQAFSLIQPSGVALTKTDDTNVTLTLGGSPTTALVNAASLTLGWSGTLAKTRGGWGLDVTTLTGYVKAAGAGSITASATIPYSDITGGPSAVTGANPTASVGLTAVNGSAGTFLRSDGAPALDQGIAPTWTALHTFSGPAAGAATFTGQANFTRSWSSGAEGAWQVAAAFPMACLYETGASANNARWAQYAVGETFNFACGNDAATSFRAWLTVYRSAVATTAITYGNYTDNPSHTFYGQINGNGAGLTAIPYSSLTGAPSIPTLAANTYTPTGTTITNTSGITALTGMYSRVGNIVTVSGTFTVTTTTIATTSRVAVSLPVASALSAVTQLAGALACRSTLAAALNSCCYADATNDRAEIQFLAPASAAAHDYSFWFQYEVI